MTGIAGDAPVRIAIFGSCVSRDTCELMPEADVVCYVARQSAIVALSPAGEGRFSSADLDSAFQAKMFEGDQRADGVDRIKSSSSDLILIDLADERRGVWRFSDGTFITNSIEAYRAGIEKVAPAAGARLIRFGTDEHFSLWRSAFRELVAQLRSMGVPLVFLDISWAEALDGSPEPRGPRFVAGTTMRRFKRGAKGMGRSLSRGESLGSAIRSLLSPEGTPIEQLANEAKRANRRFRRYSNYASTEVGSETVTRQSSEVRMTTDHRWGLAPFHYREEDYRSIITEIRGSTLRRTND